MSPIRSSNGTWRIAVSATEIRVGMYITFGLNRTMLVTSVIVEPAPRGDHAIEVFLKEIDADPDMCDLAWSWMSYQKVFVILRNFKRVIPNITYS